MTDNSKLVGEALKNGAKGFTPIVERYKDAVFGVALMRLHNFHDAEDVAQTAFLTAYERLSHLKDPDRLGAWLRSITIHQCLDHLRRRRQREDYEGRSPLAVSDTATHEPFTDEFRHTQMMQAIDGLNKVQKETVVLYYISGYSQKEIAAMQEVPVGTVKYRLHESRRKLKQDSVAMVKQVLQDNTPKQDFAGRVFELLFEPEDQRKLWRADIRRELESIGEEGMPGFVKAMSLPHWQTRRTAIFYLNTMPCSEQVIDLLIEALTDKNRNVRKYAAGMLLHSEDIDEERMRTDLIPRIARHLLDTSVRVRRLICRPWFWGKWLAELPLETVAVSLQTLQAARTNPVESLRYE